ncbi:MAG: 5'-methylthioadenosine/S-adenosylhomocysteine nucleosidase [Paracoccus sp. (in: a-proteobacteria)]|uniref:5'-methylthioadenosine/S-adenosylhomocysteine nucleosidase n=1 Tax=Paracoccus sp. TaxID=267 RepID=UPI0026DF731D|nr:5'-methylthioadenosine/S-adenosylhomocysteine nucleosidase [Paracoccus sp. (in: a-proteobacteria)]MDO5632048.1 5'-methylthioadenosine/S-adenosylhomocysteine nucleosidase [Paracoccus sp. (in: a-proteobacteria)]
MPRTAILLAALMPLPALATDLAAMPDDSPRIAVITAFAPEIAELAPAMDQGEVVRINGIDFIQGQLEGRDVVLFQSGVSMVNAAMTTQLVLDRFNIESIVFSGIAGGIDPDLNIGDVVIAGQWGQYLESIMARETDGGFAIPPFLQSQFPNYGMIFTNDVTVASTASGQPQRKFWFAADPAMLDRARAVAEGFDLAACNADNLCLSEPPQIVIGGNGVSGSAFVDNAGLRDWISDTFQAQVVDMESAAVAQVAFANDVPFIAFRSLSDLAGGGEGENEMGVFMSLAAANSAALVRAYLAAP